MAVIDGHKALGDLAFEETGKFAGAFAPIISLCSVLLFFS